MQFGYDNFFAYYDKKINKLRNLTVYLRETSEHWKKNTIRDTSGYYKWLSSNEGEWKIKKGESQKNKKTFEIYFRREI